MDFEEGKQTILTILHKKGKEKKSILIAALGGDKDLYDLVAEDLIFHDLAENKKDAGLVLCSKPEPYTTNITHSDKGGTNTTPELFISDAVQIQCDPLSSVNPHIPSVRSELSVSPGDCKIFISYGRRGDGLELAEQLEHDLSDKGYDVYRDINPVRGLKSGDDWEWVLQSEISKREIFLSILTCHAVRRPQGFCLDEIAYARSKGKTIIPLLVEDRSKDGHLCEPPLCIHRLNFIDAHSWKGAYDHILTQVVAAIHKPQQYDGLSIRLLSGKGPDVNEYKYDFSKVLSQKNRNFIGREWIQSRIDEWLNHSDDQVLLLTGDPGSGKSALLAHLSQRNPAVRAVHFFMGSWNATREPWRFIGSLALMLASQIPPYREWLESRDDYSNLFNHDDPDNMFRDLIINPLKEEWAEEKPFLILFDALDESYERGHRGIVQILSEGLMSQAIPSWIRFLISSRPVPRILSAFGGYSRYDIIDSNPVENREDIKEFLHRFFEQTRLTGIRANWEKEVSPEALIELLLARSEGSFLYISYLTKDILEKRIDPSHEEKIPTGLYEYYTQNFERLYPDLEKYQHEVRPVLDVILAAREPLDSLYIYRILGLTDKEILDRIQPLLPFIEMTKDGERLEFRPFHTSFTEWITGNDSGGSMPGMNPEPHDTPQKRDTGLRPVDYQVDLMLGNRRIGSYLEERYNHNTRDRFLLSHLPYHLYHAWQFDGYLKVVLDPEFMAAKMSHPGLGIQSLIDDLTLGMEGQFHMSAFNNEEMKSLQLIRDALRLSSHILVRDPSQFATQMFGRLFRFNETRIREFLGRVKQEQKEAWLIPLNQSFTAPDEGMKMMLMGHTDIVWKVHFCPDRKTLISGSQDMTARIWDLQSGECRKILDGRRNYFNSFALSENGNIAVSGASDGTVCIWDMQTGACVHTFREHSSLVKSVAISPDGKTVVSGSNDNTICLWTPDLEKPKRFVGHTAFVKSVLLTFDGKKIISGSGDNTIRIWDVDTGICRILQGSDDIISSVTLSPDGKTLISVSVDTSVCIWDMESGELKHTLTGHQKWARSVALTHNGKILVTGSPDTTIRVWDVTKGDCLHVLTGHTGEIWSVAITQDGKTAISGSTDRTVRVWDLESGTCKNILTGHADVVWSVAISPDGKTAASGSQDNTIRVWNIETETGNQISDGHTDSVWSVAVSQDKRTALSGSRDCTVRVWDIQAGNSHILQGHRHWVRGVGISKDGTTGVSGSDDMTIRVWDLEKRECIRVLTDHTGVVYSLIIHPDGKTLISGSSDKTVRIWDIMTGKGRILYNHDGPVYSVTLSPDGKTVFSGSFDHTIRIYNLETGVTRTINGQNELIYSMTVSPDGRYLLVWPVSYLGVIGRQTVDNWMYRQVTEGHTDFTPDVLVNIDKPSSIPGSVENTIQICDVDSGTCLKTLRGHTDWIRTVSGSPDGKWVVSGSDDQTLRIWDLQEEICLASIQEDSGAVESVAFAQSLIVAGVGDKVAFFSVENLPAGIPVITADKRRGR